MDQLKFIEILLFPMLFGKKNEGTPLPLFTKIFPGFLVGLVLLSSRSPQVTKHTAPNCKQHPKPSYLIVFKSIVRFLFADFATGIFRFFVEHYGRFKSKSVDFLLLRHTGPYKMVAQLYWELTEGVYKIAIIVLWGSLLFGFNWELLLLLGCCAHDTGMHRWFHQRKKEAALPVGNLQGFKSIENKEQHNQHHNAHCNKKNAVMPNSRHPFLHRICFWEFVPKNLKFLKIYPANGS